MLEQILWDMYVDPAILEVLDEDNKQALFCKMREEQVRRWKAWVDKLGDDPVKSETPPKSKKKVSFLKGTDGEPWVWVMGEHKNDKTIDEILKEEAIEEARKLADKQVEAELEYMSTPKIEDLTPTTTDHELIYCSVDELREKINSNAKPKNNLNNYSINFYQNKSKFSNFTETFNDLKTAPKVSQKVALWETRLKEKRTSEILEKMQKVQEEQAKQAEEESKKQEALWKEQERKAKEAEQQIREIARKARETHRLTANLDIETYAPVNIGVPPGREAVIEWYKQFEKPKNCTTLDDNKYQPWFHGLITRQEAETQLLDQPYGSFLVRLSERLWGYAISYRAKEKCKHYLVNGGEKYTFNGNNQLEYNSLSDLIEFHKKNPLSGGEKLIQPCPARFDYALKELH